MPSIEDLERQGLLKREAISRGEVDLALDRAREELAAAEELVKRFPSSAYELAYNGMLLAVTALVFSSGYRARVEQHHRTLVDFAEARLGREYAALAGEFDQARRKRHRTIYGQVKVTNREAEHGLRAARQLISVVEGLVAEGQADQD